MFDTISRGRGGRLLPLIQKLLLLLFILLLAACDTAADNSNQEMPPTAPHVEPATATATVENQPQETAEPTPVAALTEPALEPTATPTIPPELAATEPPTLSPAQPATAVQLAPVAGGFERPTFLTHAGDGRLFVSEQVGRISIIENGQVLPVLFLDIRDRVGSEALEQGLLSFVFHPDYAQNGSFFVNYTDLNGDTVVSRFQVNAADPNTADPSSEQVILTIDQPFGNHNGGQLQFGPDGYLYIGMGDGGSSGDPENNGQNPATLLGALLRIDVDGGTPYAVPADNPFVGDPNRAEEVWAYGLRNPWRFSFDRMTGFLYVADVGQRVWEEINFQPTVNGTGIQIGGQNYGWNILEGNHCYETANCDSAGTVLPVAEYSHDSGCSVTGGYVYRGSQFPELFGNYFFADYCSGIMWSLFHQADSVWVQTVVLESGRTVSSFGEDMNGELYLLDHASGEILQVQAVN